MAATLKRRFRYRVQFPLQHAMDSILARTRLDSAAVTRILIASDGLSITSEQQFAPLLANRRRIAEEFGVIFDRQLIDDVLAASEPVRGKYDAAFVKLSFHTPEQEALEKIARLRRLMAPGVKLVYFDGDDDLCIQWSGLLEHVDLYVKKQVFADVALYQREFVGKSNLTDYLARNSGRSFAENAIPRSGPVPAAHIGKIFAGYNIGLDDKITSLFRDTRPTRPTVKRVDVMCRAACSPDDWLYAFRGNIGASLQPLTQQGFTILLPDRRVDQQTYYQEMRSSRICVSPFGYGELCWRDFETILMGSLLIKPDMSHVRTEPDIFIPGETYVPVRWDYSDLAETCASYLRDDKERNRITAQAYHSLSRYYSSFAFLKCFSRILLEANIQPFTGTRAAIFAEVGS